MLLLTLATPLGFFTAFLIMTPFVVLYTMLDLKSFALHLIPVGIVVFLLSGALGPWLVTLALFFLVPAVAMGHLYKRARSARAAVTVAFVIILAQVLLELALFSVMFDIDIKAQLASIITTYFQQFEPASLIEAGWTAGTATEFSNMIRSMLTVNLGMSRLSETGWAAEAAAASSSLIMSGLPTLLLLVTFFLAVIAHALSRLALRSVPFDAPALPQAKTWKLPRSLVLYFAIAIIAVSAMSEESSGYWWIAAINLIPILEFAFKAQTIGFVFFLSDIKKWPRAISLLLCVPVLLIPHAFIIGLLDTAFPIRKYFEK